MQSQISTACWFEIEAHALCWAMSEEKLIRGAVCTAQCAVPKESGETHLVKLPAIPCIMLPKTWVQDPTRLQCGGGARDPAAPSGRITCEFLPHIMCRRDSTSDSCSTSKSLHQGRANIKVGGFIRLLQN